MARVIGLEETVAPEMPHPRMIVGELQRRLSEIEKRYDHIAERGDDLRRLMDSVDTMQAACLDDLDYIARGISRSHFEAPAAAPTPVRAVNSR